MRRAVVAGAAVLVLGGSAVGIAAAQTQPTTTPTAQRQSQYQAFIDALAKRLNISSQTLETAVTQARQDAGLPANGPFPGGGRGPRGGFRIDFNAAATAIGITPQQLHTELAGKSLAQVAQAHGKTANDVATALKNAAHQQIDTQASARNTPADQVATQKTQADQRIDQLVNQVMPQGGFGKGQGGPEGFGGRGVLGAGINAAATAIGITPQQLHTELNGKSLAEVAQAHGKNANDVATAIKTAVHQQIDSAVTAGKITADQANTDKTQADQRIDQLMTQVMPQHANGVGGEAEDSGA